ncbi:TlpA disulfide reductase family protein [Myxococcaceae bacterium GXIMD 01537]
MTPDLIIFIASWGRLLAGAAVLAAVLLVFLVVRRRTERRYLRWGAFVLAGLMAAGGAGTLFIFTRTTLGKVLDLTVGKHPLVGQRLALSFKQVSDDAPGTLDAHAGKVVLLSLWATWCEPCRHELPDIEQVSTGLAGDGLVVLMVSDEEREVLLGQPASKGPLQGYVEFDELPEKLREIARIRPVNIFIDREGIVRGVFIGPRDRAFFEQQARRYL